MQLLNLEGLQLERFLELRTTDQMQYHGPLGPGEQVLVHEHDKALYFLTEGQAQYVTADGAASEILGQGLVYNAVVVEAGEKHGWIGKAAKNIIEHVIGDANVDMVLAAA